MEHFSFESDDPLALLGQASDPMGRPGLILTKTNNSKTPKDQANRMLAAARPNDLQNPIKNYYGITSWKQEYM